jgi:hypothetical protein
MLRQRLLFGGLLWTGLAYGVLRIGTLPGEFGHGLCGPWGCLPPIQALGSLHALWLLVLIPAAWALFALHVSPKRIAWLGLSLFLLGLGGLSLLGGWEAWRWLRDTHAEFHRYTLHRVLYVLACRYEFPVIQCIAVGLVTWGLARRRASGKLEPKSSPSM